MQEEALALLESHRPRRRASLALFEPESWHQGVIGILASRIKESCTAPPSPSPRGNGGELKGSGRSIPGLHLRDALDLVAKRAPGLLCASAATPWPPALTIREATCRASRRSSRVAANCSPRPT
jgi:single-stranded-DNA-specific exonuclease